LTGSQGLKSLLAINVLAGCASGILLLALPLYTMSLKASAAELGVIGGMAGAGRMLIIAPSGIWADRYGTRRLFVISTVICALLTAVIPWVRTPLPLMAVMFFQGMAQSIGFMTLQAGFLKRLKSMNAAQAGWQRSATQLGFFLIGPLVGGPLLSGHRFVPAFLTVSLLFLAGVIVVGYRKNAGIAAEPPHPPTGTPLNDFRRMLVMLNDQNLRCVLVVEFLGAALLMTYRTFMAPVAFDLLRLSTSAVSWLLISQGTVAMCFLFWGGRLVGNRSLTWIFTTAALLAMAGNTLLAAATGFISAFLGSVVYGVGTGLLSYVSLLTLTRVAGEKGKIAVLFSLSVAVGNTVGPMAAGFVAQALGMQRAFLVPVLLMALAMASVGRYLTGPVQTGQELVAREPEY